MSNQICRAEFCGEMFMMRIPVKAACVFAPALLQFLLITGGTAFGQNEPSSPPVREKRSAASPMSEKRPAVPPTTETKPADGAAPATMLPDNCAKGNAAPAPPGVGAHIVIPPGKSPKAVCDQLSFEAEPVWKGQTMTCTYTIRNTGDADLFIRPKAT